MSTKIEKYFCYVLFHKQKKKKIKKLHTSSRTLNQQKMRRIGTQAQTAAFGAVASTIGTTAHIFATSQGHPRQDLMSNTWMLEQRRWQSMGVGVSQSAKGAASLRPTASTNTSYALFTVIGLVHDVQVGSVGEDNVLQFLVTTVTMDPVEASQKYTDICKNIENAPPQLGDKNINPKFNADKYASALGNKGSTTATSSSRPPISEVQDEKRFAMAKQPHLHSSKEQFTVRCFGGENELTALQSSLMEGVMVRVMGNFKMNLQKEPVILSANRKLPSSQQAATIERAFPYIRVDLGDAATLWQLNTKGPKSVMTKAGTTAPLVRSGMVSVIAKPKYSVNS